MDRAYDLNVSEMSFKINDPDQIGVRSCHPGGAYVLFADGKAYFLSNDSVTEKVLKALDHHQRQRGCERFFP